MYLFSYENACLRIKKRHTPSLGVPPLYQLSDEVPTALWVEVMMLMEEVSTVGCGATLGHSG